MVKGKIGIKLVPVLGIYIVIMCQILNAKILTFVALRAAKSLIYWRFLGGTRTKVC